VDKYNIIVKEKIGNKIFLRLDPPFKSSSTVRLADCYPSCLTALLSIYDVLYEDISLGHFGSEYEALYEAAIEEISREISKDRFNIRLIKYTNDFFDRHGIDLVASELNIGRPIL